MGSSYLAKIAPPTCNRRTQIALIKECKNALKVLYSRLQPPANILNQDTRNDPDRPDIIGCDFVTSPDRPDETRNWFPIFG